jgi:hypothetical protein
MILLYLLSVISPGDRFVGLRGAGKNYDRIMGTEDRIHGGWLANFEFHRNFLMANGS